VSKKSTAVKGASKCRTVSPAMGSEPSKLFLYSLACHGLGSKPTLADLLRMLSEEKSRAILFVPTTIGGNRRNESTLAVIITPPQNQKRRDEGTKMSKRLRREIL